jgi:hypothetical protein
MPPNFTDMDLRSRPPRSPRVRLGGFVHLPRLLDKARAHLAGTLGDYMWNCPLDQRFFTFTGILEADLLAELKNDRSDSEILAWVRARLPAHVNEVAIESWSRWMEGISPGDAQRHQGFADSIRQLAPNRDDIRTHFDRLDLDDHVSFGGRG